MEVIAMRTVNQTNIAALLLLIPWLAALGQDNHVDPNKITLPTYPHGWYAGGGFAFTDGYDTSNASDQSDTGNIVTVGYRYHPFVAFEAGYLTDSNMSSTQISALLIIPFAKRWEIYVKGGLTKWSADTAPAGNDDDGSTFLGGIGLGLTFWEHWHTRIEYQSFNLDTCEDFNPCSRPDPGTFDSLLVELHYRFEPN
jgi:hypothetical protein